MLKIKDLFSSITAKDGADDADRIRAAITKVEAEQSNARSELAGIADQRTEALLSDDDAALDRLDRRTEALHRTLERCEFALPQLQERLRAADKRGAEENRRAAFEKAKAAAKEAEKRLLRDYNRLAGELLGLILTATEAIAEVDRVNRDLPEGFEPVQIPPGLARGATYFPEKVVDEEIVERWVGQKSGALVDQRLVQDLGNGVGTIETATSNTPCVRRSFREISFQAEVRDHVERLDQLLVLPGLFNAEPPIWSGSSDYVEDAVELLREATAVKRTTMPKQISRPTQIRLEPL